MTILRYLKLDKQQTEKAEKFLAGLPKIDQEEDVTMSGIQVEFIAYSSGIGDVLYLKAGGNVCELSYDDDGKLM